MESTARRGRRTCDRGGTRWRRGAVGRAERREGLSPWVAAGWELEGSKQYRTAACARVTTCWRQGGARKERATACDEGKDQCGQLHRLNTEHLRPGNRSSNVDPWVLRCLGDVVIFAVSGDGRQARCLPTREAGHVDVGRGTKYTIRLSDGRASSCRGLRYSTCMQPPSPRPSFPSDEEGAVA